MNLDGLLCLWTSSWWRKFSTAISSCRYFLNWLDSAWHSIAGRNVKDEFIGMPRNVYERVSVFRLDTPSVDSIRLGEHSFFSDRNILTYLYYREHSSRYLQRLCATSQQRFQGSTQTVARRMGWLFGHSAGCILQLYSKEMNSSSLCCTCIEFFFTITTCLISHK